MIYAVMVRLMLKRLAHQPTIWVYVRRLLVGKEQRGNPKGEKCVYERGTPRNIRGFFSNFF